MKIKILILGLIALASTPAFSQEVVSERPIDHHKIEVAGSDLTNLCSDISERLNRYYAINIGYFSPQCSKVRPVINSRSSSYTTHSRVPFIGFQVPTGSESWYYLSLSLLCTPRTLVEKQVLSTYKSCEVDTKPECFSKEYLDYLSKVKQTEFVNDITSSCSSLR